MGFLQQTNRVRFLWDVVIASSRFGFGYIEPNQEKGMGDCMIAAWWFRRSVRACVSVCVGWRESQERVGDVIIFRSFRGSFNDFVREKKKSGMEKRGCAEWESVVEGEKVEEMQYGMSMSLRRGYTMEAERRVYCIWDPVFAGLGGGR